MKNKVLSVIVLVIAITMLFSACGTSDTSDNASTVSQVAEVSSESTYDQSTDVIEDNSTDESGEQLSGYTLNGVPLESYSIVFADDVYGYGREFAMMLRNDIREKLGVNLNFSDDSGDPAEYEIIFGDTNREAELKMDTLGKLDYAVCAEDKKVVVNAGEYYTLELAAKEFLNVCLASKEIAIPETPTVKTLEFEKPKSVILIIGDGMGEKHIEYTLENGLNAFIGDIMINKGYCTTNSRTGTTDSAAAATALSTGYKTVNGRVGKDILGKNNYKVMGELVIEKGKALMVTSNYDIDDATPAAFTAHANDRDENLEEIRAYQEELRKNAVVIESIYEDTDAGFYNTLMKYEQLEDKNGFFFMNEEGYCDSAGHNNEFGYSVEAVTRIDKTARMAISYILNHPDTVFIMTADHETGGITKNEETGEWEFTTVNHTGVDVPVFAMGYGTETFNGNTVDNTDISKFIAHIMGDSNWGDPKITPKITFPELN